MAVCDDRDRLVRARVGASLGPHAPRGLHGARPQTRLIATRRCARGEWQHTQSGVRSAPRPRDLRALPRAHMSCVHERVSGVSFDDFLRSPSVLTSAFTLHVCALQSS